MCGGGGSKTGDRAMGGGGGGGCKTGDRARGGLRQGTEPGGGL